MEAKKLRAMRRRAIHSKVKESSVQIKFEVKSGKDVEDIITYIRDVWKDYKFVNLMLRFVFKGEKDRFVQEVAEVSKENYKYE